MQKVMRVLESLVVMKVEMEVQVVVEAFPGSY